MKSSKHEHTIIEVVGGKVCVKIYQTAEMGICCAFDPFHLFNAGNYADHYNTQGHGETRAEAIKDYIRWVIQYCDERDRGLHQRRHP